MKKPIIFLVFLIALTVVVLPLVLVGLGKLRNPVDQFASRSATNALSGGGVTTVNYIPASGTYIGTTTARQEFAELDRNATECVAGGSEEVMAHFMLTKNEEKKNTLKILSLAEWTINGYEAKKISATTAVHEGVAVGVISVSPDCKVNDSQLLSHLYDGGKFELGFAPKGETVTNQGVSRINGVEYRWKLYEANTGLDLSSAKKENSFTATYGAFYGRHLLSFVFIGNTKVHANERDFLRYTQGMMANVRYLPVTVTPAPVPGN
ncbi:MAG TPA: hypothetical protein VGE62_03155 [Candidatus Paceibacterota bacterium]